MQASLRGCPPPLLDAPLPVRHLPVPKRVPKNAPKDLARHLRTLKQVLHVVAEEVARLLDELIRLGVLDQVDGCM